MRTLLFLLALLLPLQLHAQRHELLSDRVASLQVTAGDDWLRMPIVELGSDVPIVISFDDLTHEYHRYCYRIEHCEADWTPSKGLFESDYCEGFTEGNTIDDMVESINTNQLYTHYALQIPNNRCRLKMSGNYRVTVYDENDASTPVLTACFMVVEPLMSVRMEVTTNTDVDINHQKQQVAITVGYGPLRVTDPQSQIKTVVLQNGRWDNARINVQPQYVMADGLRWDHCRDLIFDCGNEYRKFEMLDPTHPTMGLESVTWDGQRYHAWVFTDEPRPSYIYDKDANGAFVIRNSDNIEVDNTCDYLLAHFRLRSPRLPGDVYLNGNWTNDRFLPEYRMMWNEATQEYEGAVWLKQGYYSYQYLEMKEDGTLRPVPSEGNFYQTENQYQVLVYYRGQGERTDRLVSLSPLTPSP